MFHKAKCFNHQLVQFKIKRTLVNRDAKVVQKNKKQYDVRIFCISVYQSFFYFTFN